eukprot:1808457-Lingulodinium_polyedra.AAC.1
MGVLSSVIPTPAQNKWTQVYPVIAEVALRFAVHQLMPRAIGYARTKIPADELDSADEGDVDDSLM